MSGLKTGSSSPTVYIDGRGLMYRAFYAFKDGKDLEGRPNGMLQGFMMLLMDAMRAGATNYVVVWDSCDEAGRGAGTWRHRYFPEYKANRVDSKKDADREAIYQQYPTLCKMIDAIGIPQTMIPDLEADDIIGILCNRPGRHKIFSKDEDFYQLLSPRVSILQPAGGGATREVTPESVLAEHGVDVRRWATFKALCGDPSDNYKGLPGCGPVKAKKYLDSGFTWEGGPDEIVRKFPEIKPHVQYLRTCYELAYIPRKADYFRFSDSVKIALTSLLTEYENGPERRSTDEGALRDICNDWDLSIIWERRRTLLT